MAKYLLAKLSTNKKSITVVAHLGVWVLLGCLAFQFYYMFASTFLRLLRALKSRMNEKSSLYGIVSQPKI